MTKMTESQLLAIVNNDLTNAQGISGSALSKERTLAMQYYMGEKVGKLLPSEIADSSEVVSRDVMDTIEWIMPSLIRIFTSGDDVVTFEPQGVEDEELAKQATDWCNYVFTKQNDGFLILHSWFKDALIQKIGIVKTWWDESVDVTTEEYEAMTLEDITMMLQSGDVEIMEQSPNEDGSLNIKVKRTKKLRQIRTENVPPEEFLFSKNARSSSGLTACHHRMQRTVSELRAMGYKNVERLSDDDNGAEFAEEAQARDDEFLHEDDRLDEAMRKIWITESYLQVDWDGDGIAEWRKVCKTGKVLLDNEETDGHPFDIITPILMPHKMVGLSLADMVMDLQEIKTALLRQSLDNMYLQNNPRMYVDESKRVNIDDLLDSRIGGIVRGNGEKGVTPLVTAPLSPQTFGMMEYIDPIKENRTGITKYNQGLDANSLNKTATGINAIMGAAQQRIELVARVFAETGVKDLFKRYLKLSSQHETKQRIVRLRNKYVQIDPRAWSTQYDVNVSVGVGTGNRDQIAMHLMNIMQVQEKMIAGGMPTVDPKRIYNSAKRLAENLGFKDGDLFFIDPDAPPKMTPEQQQKAQQQQQEQEMQKQLMIRSAVAEISVKEADAEKKRAEAQAVGMPEQQERQPVDLSVEEFLLKREEVGARIGLDTEKLQLEREKMVIDAQLKGAQLEQKQQPTTAIQLGNDDAVKAASDNLAQVNQQGNAELVAAMMNGFQEMSQGFHAMAAALSMPKTAIKGADGKWVMQPVANIN